MSWVIVNGLITAIHDDAIKLTAANTKVEKLRQALERARDTFEDTRKVLLMLQHDIAAEAMDIALEGTHQVLADMEDNGY